MLLASSTKPSCCGSISRAMPSSPTDYLANERTLLAWVRTSMAIIGLGFVVARFGLFLRELAVASGTSSSLGSSSPFSQVFGVGLIVLGGGLMVPAYLSFTRNRRDLDAGRYVPREGVARAMTVAILVVTG